MIGWLFTANSERDTVRSQKIRQGRSALVEAAATTSDLAKAVTRRLKQQFAECMQEFEGSAPIVHEAMVIASPDGHVDSMNPAAERLFGVTASDTNDILTLFVNDLGKAIQSPDTLWKLLENRVDTSILGRKADGTTFPFDAITYRLNKNNGNYVMLLIIRDLSFYTVAEITANHLRSIFEYHQDAIAVFCNGSIVAATETFAAKFGHTADTILEVTMEDIFKEQTVEAICCSATISFVAHGWTKDGAPVEIAMATSPISWEGQEAWVMNVKSLSDLKRLSSS